MAKMYTLDGKLLVGSPVIKVGSTAITVDDRTKTVKKAMRLWQKKDGAGDDIDRIEELLSTVLSADDARKIEEMDMPFRAYQRLTELIMAALTGTEPEEGAFPAEEG